MVEKEIAKHKNEWIIGLVLFFLMLIGGILFNIYLK